MPVVFICFVCDLLGFCVCKFTVKPEKITDIFFLLHPVLQKAVNNKTLSAQAFIINLATYVGNNIQDGYTDIFWG